MSTTAGRRIRIGRPRWPRQTRATVKLFTQDQYPLFKGPTCQPERTFLMKPRHDSEGGRPLRDACTQNWVWKGNSRPADLDSAVGYPEFRKGKKEGLLTVPVPRVQGKLWARRIARLMKTQQR